MVSKNDRDYFERRRKQLDKEYSSFNAHYKSLSEFISVRRGRFSVDDVNKGDRRYNNIINSRASQAHRISRAGLFAGVMSPARPWFKLGVGDPDLMKRPGVKVWLSQVEELMRNIFNEGNLYNMAPQLLGELLLFGTGAMTHVDDFEDVARFYTHTAGSYRIAQDDRFKVNTLMRRFKMTTEQMVGEFGLKNVSVNIRRLYGDGNYHNWHTVTHFIEPNPNFDPSSRRSSLKRFRSVKYDASDSNKEMFLSQKGFDQFPAYVPRWDVTGEDVFGTESPAMTALGDIRGLQVKEKRKAQGIEKQVNPPLHGPASLSGKVISGLPGNVTIYDDLGGKGLRPIYEVKPDIGGMVQDIEKTERMIDEAFFVDLFLAISRMEGIQPKNELELSQRNAERLLQLGPVLERIHGEFLNDLIDRTFGQMVRAGILPDAPPELADQALKVKYISSLAQAQRSVATGAIERLFGFVGNLASTIPGVFDKLNVDEAIEEYSEIIGTPPRLVRPQEEVDAKRKAQAEALAQAQAVTTAAEGAGAVKDAAAGVKSLTEAQG